MDHEIVKKMETTKIEDEKGKKAESGSEVINAQMFYVNVCVCVCWAFLVVYGNDSFCVRVFWT